MYMTMMMMMMMMMMADGGEQLKPHASAVRHGRQMHKHEALYQVSHNRNTSM